MKTLVPAFYRDFHCIGSACRDNCCIGWEIDIDDRTAAFYWALPGAFGDRLRQDIDWNETASFRLKEGDRCPFLNGDNLCDIIIKLGEEHLCDICDRHPRFRNVLGNYAEMGLGLCCEEAARLLLSREEKMTLLPGPDIDEEPEELDPALISALQNARQGAFEILQNRSCSILDRAALLLDYAETFAAEAAEEDEFFLPCGDSADPADGEADSLQPAPEEAEIRRLWQGISELLLSLERLDEAWTPLVKRLAEPAEKRELPDTPFEQLLWYYLHRYVMTAAEDGDFAGKIGFAVLSFLVIRKLTMQGGELTDIARRYAKEVEYSAENLDALAEALSPWGEECLQPEALKKLLAGL